MASATAGALSATSDAAFEQNPPILQRTALSPSSSPAVDAMLPAILAICFAGRWPPT